MLYLTIFLILLVGGGVWLGPLGTAATDWRIVACPGWLWWWRIWWNEDWQEKPKYSQKTHPSATLFTTNPTWPDPGSNPDRRGGKPATNRLSYGAAYRGPFLVSKERNAKSITLLYLVLRLRIRGTLPPLSHTPSWRCLSSFLREHFT
jgi:hypothetical protein